MTHAFSRLVLLALAAGALLPPLVAACTALLPPAEGAPLPSWGPVLASAPLTLAAGVALAWLVRRLEPALDALGAQQAGHLDRLDERYVELAIAGSAAVSLYLELAVIRWQGTVWEFFAFYKNLGLLSCFAGLGLGYALAGRDRLPLALSAPLLAFQVLLLEGMRHGLGEDAVRSLLVTPFPEQLTMGLDPASGFAHYAAIYSFVAVVFLLTALAFLPVGQLCGRLMGRRPPLAAYRLNLLGSLAGVALMLAASFLWTPPLLWFAAGLAGLAAFQGFRRGALAAAALGGLAALVVLAWPVSPGWERVYSPYQLLERGPGERGMMLIRAAGQYYQRVLDLSPAAQAIDPRIAAVGRYYELPYHVRERPPERVAIVGAGSGNDVAAALRSGAAAVDAVEIDPAIHRLGELYHPERPYADPRVRFVNDDARAFLRTTPAAYDLIVYGLLDSHTLLSHASSVRLDSFVYTVEGLREARARLRPGGVVSLAFSVMSDEIGRKIYLMMREAFDGRPPVCVHARYDGSILFLQSKEGDLALPPLLLARSGFADVTARFADEALRADVSTDDWPFFYMPRRVFPRSYVAMLGLVLALSVAFFAAFLRERPRTSEAAFFLLGAGFMLVETKGITETGLVLGNTWQVIGVVVAGVLVMAYLANGVVSALAIRRPLVPYLLLLASLGLGLAVAAAGGFAPTAAGKAATVLVLTCPLFFSGIVFSTLVARAGNVASALALNLLGAMVGGLLEYNSMWLGFRSLYWLAIVLYAAALVTSVARRPGAAAPR